MAAASSMRTHGTSGIAAPSVTNGMSSARNASVCCSVSGIVIGEHGVDAARERHALEEPVAGRDVGEVVEQHVVARLGERVGRRPPRRWRSTTAR
jgi:hypothetical protein